MSRAKLAYYPMSIVQIDMFTDYLLRKKQRLSHFKGKIILIIWTAPLKSQKTTSNKLVSCHELNQLSRLTTCLQRAFSTYGTRLFCVNIIITNRLRGHETSLISFLDNISATMKQLFVETANIKINKQISLEVKVNQDNSNK